MKEYWACLNNPDWRKVLKAWIRFGISREFDGFTANYFYRTTATANIASAASSNICASVTTPTS